MQFATSWLAAFVNRAPTGDLIRGEERGMSEFAAELRARVDDVDAELGLMREAFDDHAIEVLSGRLENLLRIADRHGIDVRYAADAADAPAGEVA
jgi:hypothetical protein